MGLGPVQNYLAKYNNYQLPGYVQQESFSSEQRIAEHYGPYADGSNSEYVGLNNKNIQLTFKVWEQDYASCKEQVQQAATMLRSKRGGFAPLYVQYNDRYYDALVGIIRVEKTAGTPVRLLEYQVEFECKPWLIASGISNISGTDTINTTGRTIADGGWTPATVTLTGTDVTVSGYTINGDFAGFISVSGAVTNLIVDSEAFTATVGGVNKNSAMLWKDYRMYVGPEVTYYDITGASSCSIDWHNRWYI